MIGVRVEPFSISPAHHTKAVRGLTTFNGSTLKPRVFQPRTSNFQREILGRKLELIKEVEGFFAEGLELGLSRFAEEPRKDIEAIKRRL